ncbi:uncharacterized protein LOC121615610 [Chelmon rostratus]|uniref:uncharacterized protein LOC121615610 n=1 Tax=Chelmon rostratus TaxID=109905 RepID=UPI001BEBB712|nr:uncharacterized protein LOC121615610 [Chelmon rostratus]
MSSGYRVTMSERVMSSGVFVVQVCADLLSRGRVEVRAELSDGSFLQLNRTDEDLALMMKRLVDRFLDDGETLSSDLLTGLLEVQAAEQSSDPQVKTVEVNKLLTAIVNLPHQFSRSEAVLAFFEPSDVDRTFRKEEDQTLNQQEVQTLRQEAENQTLRQNEDQDHDVFQSPVVLSEIMRSNGFCLANTETILFDLTPPTHPVTQSDDCSGRRMSVGSAVCLQLCRSSVSPHLLRGFTGMMGKLMMRRSFRSTPPPCPAPSTCRSPGLRRRTSWTEWTHKHQRHGGTD